MIQRWLRRHLFPLKWIRPHWCTLDNCLARPGVAWLPCADAGPWFPAPRQYGWDGYEVMCQLPAQHPRLGVLDLRDGRIDDRGGTILLQDGTVVPATTWWSEHPAMAANIRLRRWAGAGPRLAGTTLSLVSDWADNYGHFLHDVLGKLAVAREAGVDFRAVDHIVLPVPPSPHAQLLLDRACGRCGIPRGKLRWWRRERLRCERLLAPLATGIIGVAAPPAAQALRRLLARDQPCAPSSSARRLYVDRRGYSRDLINGGDILRLVQAAGFEAYHPEDHPDSQADDFAGAGAVIGLHGSALANLVFCAPGTPVIEIMSTDHAHLAQVAMGFAAPCRHALVFADAGRRQPRVWGTGLVNSLRPSTVDPHLIHAAATALAMPGWAPRAG